MTYGVLRRDREQVGYGRDAGQESQTYPSKDREIMSDQMNSIRRVLGVLIYLTVAFSDGIEAAERPNILFCISDDQSYSHTGANGDPVVKTPAFDRIAREGLRFRTVREITVQLEV